MATEQLQAPPVNPSFKAVAEAMSAKPNEPLLSPEQEENKRNQFFEKFTGKEAPPEKPATSPFPEDTKKEEKAAETAQPEKKIPYQKQQAETRRKLEEENTTLKQELERYKTQELPTLSTQIEELKKQIDSTDSKKASEEMEKKVKEYETMLNHRNEEYQKLQEKVERFDFQNSDRFQSDFVKPLNHAYSEVLETLYANPEAAKDLEKAAIANEAYLNATDPQERQRQFIIRNEILGDIRDTLQPYLQTSFDSATGRLWEASKRRVEAIQTQKQLSQTWTVEAKEKEHNYRQVWKKAFDEAGQTVQVDHPEELAKIIAEKKINDSIDEDSAIAEDLIIGGTKFTPLEYSRVIQQGRNFGKMKAQRDAALALVKDLEANISRLQGTNTGNGNGAPPPTLGGSNGTSKHSQGLQSFAQRYGIPIPAK